MPCCTTYACAPLELSWPGMLMKASSEFVAGRGLLPAAETGGAACKHAVHGTLLGDAEAPGHIMRMPGFMPANIRNVAGLKTMMTAVSWDTGTKNALPCTPKQSGRAGPAASAGAKAGLLCRCETCCRPAAPASVGSCWDAYPRRRDAVAESVRVATSRGLVLPR